MLNVGARAPEIDKVASDGTRFVLSAQGGLCTVVYFFPKAFTPGCTTETRQFRDNYVEIALAGASIVGISTDDHRTQCRFADSLKAPFPMLADDDLHISRAYDVLWPLVGMTRRVTFIIGPDMHVAAVFQHNLKIQKHRDDVLAFIDARFRATRPQATRPQKVPSPPHDPLPAASPFAAPSSEPLPSPQRKIEAVPPFNAGASPREREPYKQDSRASASFREVEPASYGSRRSDVRSRVIAGRFALDRRVASGASGDIYQALDRNTASAVAVKILRNGPNRDDARFEREATILSELRHPGVVEYIAHGIEPDGEAYLVTEWLEGESLARRLARARLSIDECLTLGVRVAPALGAAHARGIIHRDLKPNNLFLVGGAVDRAKLIDFGVSRPASVAGDITAPGDVIGTPGYMSPEQARAREQLDARADVFSLGCVLFQCLTGETAFKGTDMVMLLMSVLQAEVPRATDVNPNVPPAVSDLLARMLSKAPEGRPADGNAIAAELAKLHGPSRALGAEHARAPSNER